MDHRYALVSVYNKEGVVGFSNALSKQGFHILSTGGTAAVLKKKNVPFTEVSDVTGFPEMLDGRVKTLHPIIHAGILARRDSKTHLKTLKDHHIQRIDFVVCNLYPFEETIRKPYRRTNPHPGGSEELHGCCGGYGSCAVPGGPCCSFIKKGDLAYTSAAFSGPGIRAYRPV